MQSKWIEQFKLNKLPVRDDLNLETEEAWQLEFDKTKKACLDRDHLVKKLTETNGLTICPLTDNVFDHYLTILNKIEVDTNHWLEESDSINDPFIELVKTNTLLSKDIYMTRPYKKTWLIEFDNYINEQHVATFFAVSFQKLKEFLFISLYSNLFQM